MLRKLYARGLQLGKSTKQEITYNFFAQKNKKWKLKTLKSPTPSGISKMKKITIILRMFAHGIVIALLMSGA